MQDKKNLYMISAVSLNGVIGVSSSNSIPWHLPTDFANFKKVTTNSNVVMGSRTFESLKKPLKNRYNIVISRNDEQRLKMVNYRGANAAYASLDDMLAADAEFQDYFIIGGESIYADALRFAPAKLYITIINEHVNGNVKFPIDGSVFRDCDIIHVSETLRYKCISRSEWLTENDIQFQFVVFKNDSE